MAQIPKLNSLWTSPSFFLAKASQAADKQQFTLVRQPGKDEGGEGVFVRCSVTGCPFMLDLRPFTIGKFRVEEACHEHSHSVLYPVTTTATLTRSRTLRTSAAPPASTSPFSEENEPFRFPARSDEPMPNIPLNLPPWDYAMITSDLKRGTSMDPTPISSSQSAQNLGTLQRSNTSFGNTGLGRSASAVVSTLPEGRLERGPTPKRADSTPMTRPLGRTPTTINVKTNGGGRGIGSVRRPSSKGNGSDTASIRWADQSSPPSLSSSAITTPYDVPTTPETMPVPIVKGGKKGDLPTLPDLEPLSLEPNPEEGERIVFSPVGQSLPPSPRSPLAYDRPSAPTPPLSLRSRTPGSSRHQSESSSSSLAPSSSMPIRDFLASCLPDGRLVSYEKTFKDAGVDTLLPLMTLDDEECREFLKHDLSPPMGGVDLRLVVSGLRGVKKRMGFEGHGRTGSGVSAGWE